MNIPSFGPRFARRRFFTQWKPSTVVVACSNATRRDFQAIEECLSRARFAFNNRDATKDEDSDDDDGAAEEKVSSKAAYVTSLLLTPLSLRSLQKKNLFDDDYMGDWQTECTFYDDNLAQLFSRSPRGSTEFPGLEVGNRVAIGVARTAISPLVEVCAAWSVASELGNFGIEALYINLHPMQNMLPKGKLLKEYERVLCDCVAAVGVTLTRERELAACLQFVPGFGPRKSQMFRQNLKALGKSILHRQDLVMEKSLGIKTKIFENAAAYIKLWDRHEYDPEYDEDTRTLFDTTRIHPER